MLPSPILKRLHGADNKKIYREPQSGYQKSYHVSMQKPRCRKQNSFDAAVPARAIASDVSACKTQSESNSMASSAVAPVPVP